MSASAAVMAPPSRRWIGHLRRSPLLAFVLFYTVVSGGPFVWVAVMSLRTTPEILDSPFALPSRLHFEKFVDAWTRSNYGTYFWNSTVVVVTAVTLLTIIGAALAHSVGVHYKLGHFELTVVVLLANFLSFAVFWVVKLLIFNRLFKVELEEFDEHLTAEEAEAEESITH